MKNGPSSVERGLLGSGSHSRNGSQYGAVNTDKQRLQGEVEIEPGNTGCCRKIFPYGYWGEFKELWRLAWPMVLTQLSQFFIGPMALIFCGHLGKVELDAVALANSMINVTGISVATGLSAACDTLFSQLYGSINKVKLGVALQKSLLVITLAVLPCWAIHLNTEAFLRVIGQDPLVSKLTGQYMLIFMPGALAFFLYISLAKYIQNQNVVIPNLVIGLIANIVNALAHYIFIYVLEMSTDGSAIAQDLSYFTMLILTLIYIIASKIYKDTWEGWSTECLQDWGTFCKLAVFGLLMLCIEWWSFEVGILLSGVLGTTELGAQSVIFQLEGMSYMLPLGMGIGASIRVGQYLGSGNPQGALTATRVALSMICVSGLCVGLLLALLRNYLPRIFTNVEEVVDLASTLLPILGIYMVFDSIAGVCAGILRGSGRQILGAVIIFFIYMCALGMGIPLMFMTGLRTSGFWWGLAAGLAVESVIFFLIITLTNWDKQVEKAQSRTHADEAFRRESVRATEGASSDGGLSDRSFGASGVENDEHTDLLPKSGRGSLPYTPVDPLLKTASHRRRYSSKYQDLLGPVFTPVVEPTHKSTKVLVLKRLSATCAMLVIFGAGVALRMTIELSDPATTLCLPLNSTEVNSTLSHCSD